MSDRRTKDFDPRVPYIAILVLSAVVLLSAAAAPWWRISQGESAADTSSMVAAIIAALTLTIASAIFLPEIRLKSIADQLEDNLNAKNRTEIETLRNEFANEVATLRTDVVRLDAQLSRVVGVLLHRDDSLWSLGWLLRAARRYASLPANERERYTDLQAMITTKVAECVADLRSDVRPGASFDDVVAVAQRRIFDNTPFFGKSEDDSKQKSRKVIRLIKDFFDLSLFYRTMISTGELHTDGIRAILLASTPAAYVLALTLLRRTDRLTDELRKISYSKEWGDDTAYEDLVKPALIRAQANSSRLIADFLDDGAVSLGVAYLELQADKGPTSASTVATGQLAPTTPAG